MRERETENHGVADKGETEKEIEGARRAVYVYTADT